MSKCPTPIGRGWWEMERRKSRMRGGCVPAGRREADRSFKKAFFRVCSRRPQPAGVAIHPSTFILPPSSFHLHPSAFILPP
jgi:hypothetical protein